MKRMIEVAAVGLVTLCIVPAVATADPAEDERAIRAGVNEWLGAFKSGDIDHLMTLYMPDALVALHGQRALRGIEEIRAYFAPGMGKSDIGFDIEIDEIRIHGDMAYLVSRYWYTATPRDGGDAYRDAGRSLVLYARDRDGRWKIQVDIDQATPDVVFDDRRPG